VFATVGQRREGRVAMPAKKPAKSGGDGKAFRPYHSTNVPKEADLEKVFHSDGDQPITTLMLRHIPNKYSQSSLLKEIDFKGFQGKYDFFYMPMDVHNRTNVGYAFINFVDTRDARDFFLLFSNYRFECHTSGKIGTVAPGHVQGLENNVCQFGPRAVATAQNVQYRPLVFRDGKQVDLKTVFQELQHKGCQVPELLKPSGWTEHFPVGAVQKVVPPGLLNCDSQEAEEFCARQRLTDVWKQSSLEPCFVEPPPGLYRSPSSSTSASTDRKEVTEFKGSKGRKHRAGGPAASF